MQGIYNLYLPICGLIIAIICNIVFFSKERIRNKETAIFSRELIYSLIDSLLMVTIIYLALFRPSDIICASHSIPFAPDEQGCGK